MVSYVLRARVAFTARLHGTGRAEAPLGDDGSPGAIGGQQILTSQELRSRVSPCWDASV